MKKGAMGTKKASGKQLQRVTTGSGVMASRGRLNRQATGKHLQKVTRA